MCGIFGSLGFTGNLQSCLDTLALRGPDDWGDYHDREQGLYLGQRRLSILDVSRAGRQPMSLEDSGLVIVYNGETYNYQELAAQYLPGTAFQSSSDTEVILHLYRALGDKTPEQLRGMFALAVYDRYRGKLFLSRDRLGIKPLYYYEKDGTFAFASELSALKALDNINLEIDPIALDYYFTYGYIPAPLSAYKHIRKLRPGHNLTVDIATRRIQSITSYWNPLAATFPTYRTEADWLEAIEAKIEEAINIRLISDVPLGAFLSGGLDSSLVVSKMAKLMDQPVETFTIGFGHQAFDEREYATALAEHYGTHHHEEVVEPDAVSLLPKLVDCFGEPFADPSAIPTYYVARMARQRITVALSGDGGDEVFAGYTRYHRLHQYRHWQRVPPVLRKNLQTVARWLPEHLPGYGLLQRQAYDHVDLYRELVASFTEPERMNLYTPAFRDILTRESQVYFERILDEQGATTSDPITQLQTIDLNSYLPADILTKVDRTTMLNSLEARVPLLDHELIELALACPVSIRFKNGTLKYIIKRLLDGQVPEKVRRHAKQGFGLPLSHWFRQDWKETMESHLREQARRPEDGLLNASWIHRLLDLHQHGGRDFGRKLYAILFFQTWQASQ